MTLTEKYNKLQGYLSSLESVAIAFSGGVDSTFLLKVSHGALGDCAVAITARSASYPLRELNEAACFTKAQGIKHIIFDSEELDIEGFSNNPPNRCYLCKKELFTKIKAICREHNIAHIAEGSNVDDTGDYRPGLTAARELNVLSPLREAGLTKAEIRRLSEEMGLPTWDKPSFACLSSRFVYGEAISKEKLKAVELSEQLLFDMGFKQVRVRVHGHLARIEVPQDEIERFLTKDIRDTVYAKLKEHGFLYVTLDLLGYRTGSMNEGLKNTKEVI